jgi:protein-S-isoprenylcysteine O-methyltransferase Ste14
MIVIYKSANRGASMSLVPAFQIGVWNAWILQALFYLAMFVPDIFQDEEEKKRTKRLRQFVLFKKTEKVLALSTHAVIMPVVFIYSIFLPLKTGTPWLPAGLPVLAVALVISVAAIFNVGATPDDEPATRGVYRVSRHPIYLSGFLMYLGTGICCASWPVLFGAVLWIVFWHIAVPTEEEFLIERYGDSYRKYMSRTPRWIGIPKVG